MKRENLIKSISVKRSRTLISSILQVRLGYFIVFMIFLFTSCENDIEQIKLITQKKNIPSESGKEIEILYSDSGIVKLQLISAQMDHYPSDNPYLEMPKGVKVLFFDHAKNVKSTLTANYAIHWEGEKRMEAKRNVVVINEKGEQLNTEHLIWNEQTSKIYSDEFVKITTKDEIIFGQGFESNQNFTKYKINKIKGTLKIAKK